MRKLQLSSLFVFLLFFQTIGFGKEGQSFDQKSVEKLKWTVVKLEVANRYGLDTDFPYSGSGTGFIVDKQRGIVVTNRHVVTASPLTKLKINFYNNKSVDGKVLYIDPWHDFAFVQFDPKDKNIDFSLSQVELGSQKDVHEGDEVLLIGHSSGADYSVKSGTINKKLIKIGPVPSERHSHHIHVSLPRAGGASGAPLWNVDKKVIGLHSAGKDNESYEVRIDYIRDALETIQKGKMPTRGDVFVLLDAIQLFRAKEGYDLPENYVTKGVLENSNFHYAILISKLIQGTEAYKKLQVGDFIIGIRGSREKNMFQLGYSLYDFDRIVNQNVGGKVILSVYRQNKNNGKSFDIELTVHDANQYIPNRFAILSGAVFQDVTPSLSFRYNWPLDGVYLNSALNGSSFSSLASSLKDEYGDLTDEKAVLIKKIDGIEVHNLDDFIRIMKPFKDGEVLNVCISDMQSYFTGDVNDVVYLSIITDPLKMYVKDRKLKKWVEDKI
ncbi:MAG: trypsin-like peptidase domain-containing protein [Bdellovibrionales bacterium]|nr:trypsin-like peptidase domain-containing protein [Bdellovibrionales bacterium]